LIDQTPSKLTMPVKFENEESLLDAIKDVRNDATETNWYNFFLFFPSNF